MPNITETIEKTKVCIKSTYARNKASEAQLAKAREVLARYQDPKKVYTPLCFSNFPDRDYINIIFMDQDENVQPEIFPKRTELYAFIQSFYSSTHDTCSNGEHVQYEDTRSIADYFEENKDEVLTDYLNNR